MKRRKPLQSRKPLRETKGLKPGGPIERKTEMKRTRTMTPAALARWRAGLKDRCERRGCGSQRGLRQHHVVYAQHVRKRGGDVYDPRNSFTACWDCHNGHHHRIDHRIDILELSDTNIEFAIGLLGDYVVDYFVRYYDGDREQIEGRVRSVRQALA